MIHPSTISISEFTYDLPAKKIAEYPLENRDESKLLIFKNDKISEGVFKDISSFLEEDSALVFNKTKVILARLFFKTSMGQAIEIFCLEPHEKNEELSIAMGRQKASRWNCLVGNLKRWKEKTLIITKDGKELNATIVEKQDAHVVIDFLWKPSELCFAEILAHFGNIPIPPYIKRASEDLDLKRYQTIYAEKEGSVAAPTAGLHFTDEVMKSLEKKNVKNLSVTLHVGAGTFKPVKAQSMQDHDMHSEWIEVEKSVIEDLVKMQSENKKIIVVGTTSLRTIETLYWMGVKVFFNSDITAEDIEIKQWDAYNLPRDVDVKKSLESLLKWMNARKHLTLRCHTQILIAPPYQLKLAAGIITNFHQPQSTLLLLISAIVGDRWKDIYEYALKNDFRFLSYGDSSLLLKE